MWRSRQLLWFGNGETKFNLNNETRTIIKEKNYK